MYLRQMCVEPEGAIIRIVQSVVKTPELIWWLYDQVKGMPNFVTAHPEEFTHESMLWLFLPEVKIYLIDDVGVVVLRRLTSVYADVHPTFWDRRLRGREELARQICHTILAEEQLDVLHTDIELASRVVMAFAKRVGFVSRSLAKDPVQHMVLYKGFPGKPQHGAYLGTSNRTTGRR